MKLLYEDMENNIITFSFRSNCDVKLTNNLSEAVMYETQPLKLTNLLTLVDTMRFSTNEVKNTQIKNRLKKLLSNNDTQKEAFSTILNTMKPKTDNDVFKMLNRTITNYPNIFNIKRPSRFKRNTEIYADEENDNSLIIAIYYDIILEPFKNIKCNEEISVLTFRFDNHLTLQYDEELLYGPDFIEDKAIQFNLSDIQIYGTDFNDIKEYISKIIKNRYRIYSEIMKPFCIETNNESITLTPNNLPTKYKTVYDEIVLEFFSNNMFPIKRKDFKNFK